MPLVYQQNINETTRIAVWLITEGEPFFLAEVPLHRDISHWHKRLQHLAGRLLLRQLYPDFPVSLIKIADTKKPFLENEPYHFSISHCGDYAASIVSKSHRVGVDVEKLNPKIERIQHKFIYEDELKNLLLQNPLAIVECLTLIWSVKESIFKWWGLGNVDFKEDIKITAINGDTLKGTVHCLFKNETNLIVNYLFSSDHFLSWVLTDH